MGHQEIHAYFGGIVEWMKNDIQCEIQLARASETEDGRSALDALGIEAGGGNLLAGLGLVAYTEALGRFRLFNRGDQSPASEESFIAFFDAMADGKYRAWREEWESRTGDSLYEALRCGLVHEYHPKVGSAFHIGAGDELGLAEEDGLLTFKVEPYLRDFAKEADRLYWELLRLDEPVIPTPHREQSRPRVNDVSPLVQRSS